MAVPALPQVASDPTRRGGLALVRLRLRLALMAMAIVPVVISLALLNVVFESQDVDARSHAAGESAIISAALASQIQRTEGMLLVLGSDRGFDRALVDPASPASMDRAREGLRTLAAASGALVPEARLSSASGAVILEMSAGNVLPQSVRTGEDPTLLQRTLALPVGGLLRSDSFRGPDGAMRFTLTAPIAADGNPGVHDGG